MSKIAVKPQFGKYRPLDTVEPDEIRDPSIKTQRWWKLTRFHVTAISFLAVVFIVLIVYTGTKVLHFSPTTLCSLGQSKSQENAPAVKLEENASRHPAHTRRRLPQCIIIGVRKGGTRALLRFLNLHPNVQAAGREIHFFDDDQNYSLGYDWYRKKMPFSYSDQITMEKSPAYFVDEKVPERVWQMNSSISLLLVVRDPVERAVSDYSQLMYNKIDRGRPFKRFESNAIDPLTGEVNKHYAVIRRSVYHRHMTRWLNYFHLRQFLVISGEELVQDPVSVIRQVEEFLAIEHRVDQKYFYYNETRGFYCVREELKESCLAESKGRPHPDINLGVINKLKQYFRPHNEEFFKLIGRRFDSWTSD